MQDTQVAGALATTAAELDAQDELAFLRRRFHLPDEEVYCESTCLGPLPVNVPQEMARTVAQEWGRGLLSSWWEAGWWDAPRRVGDKVGRLVGAAPGRTVVGDSTTVQLFNALVAAARLRPERRTLLAPTTQFTTVRYITDSVARLLGLRVRRVAPAELSAALGAEGDDVAVLVHEAVDFRTGEAHDLAGLTRAAHAAGVVCLWDLSHGAGVLPVGLDVHDVDFAVGCTYKYLCGGPGAPAFLYVNARHQDAVDQPLPGWTGHAEPFAMRDVYHPAEGIDRGRIGTPSILSMIALEHALDAYEGVTIEQIGARGRSLTGFFLTCADELLTPQGVGVATPREPQSRAGHMAVRHPDAEDIIGRLRKRGVYADRRPPDLMRFGLHPLFCTHREVLRVVTEITEVIA
ncbi:kynureninase [Streptomyces monticola]|uniref:Kynureninase n=1 Tax=Streptomyces monticola TaxID=2666263 RepID=A0ABW2JLR5_9ACTN